MIFPFLSVSTAFPRRVPPLLALLGIGALLYFGCSSRPEARRRSPPQPRLAAHAEFFGGTIGVRTELAAIQLARPERDGGEGESGPRSSGRHRRGGGGGGPGGFGGPPPEGGESPRPPMGGGFSMPRMSLQLTLSNHGSQPVTVVVSELVSLLGNFSPREPKLTLAPGQEAAIDPFVSGFPENFDELSVEIHLQRNGTNETQTLRLVRDPAPPAP